MAKITFVYPDSESLGVAYLMAACIRAGHEIELVFYVTGESFMDIFKKQRVDFKNIANKVAATKPDIVAFSCMTDFYHVQLKCANAIKEIIPHAVTIFGGVHPTAVPDVVLKEKNIDCVAIGEAEESFLTFLKECRFEQYPILPQHKVDGIVFKLDGNFIGEFREGKLPDLNTIAFPYKKPFYDSFKAFSRRYSILTSRGCPFCCSYCFNSSMYSVRGQNIVVRQRKVDNVISELLQAKRDYTPKNIFFADDCFVTNEAWLMEFCNRYKKEINIPFGCAAIPSFLNKSKVQILRDAGCNQIQIGVQSLDENLCRDVLLRRSNNIKIAEAISSLKDAGIIVQADHILGIPGDTIAIEEENVLFYNKNRPNVISVYWLSYYPKTKIVEMARQNGCLSMQDVDAINNGVYSGATKGFSLSGTNQQYYDYYGIDFLLNFLPFLPGKLVEFLINRKAYKIFSFKKIFFRRFFKLLSNFMIVIFQRKNLIHQDYLFLAISRIFYNKKIVSKR